MAGELLDFLRREIAVGSVSLRFDENDAVYEWRFRVNGIHVMVDTRRSLDEIAGAFLNADEVHEELKQAAARWFAMPVPTEREAHE